MAVAFAEHVLESALFLELLDQILVKRDLEFGRQLDLVRCNHEYLNRGGLLCRGRNRLGMERCWRGEGDQNQNSDGGAVENALHGFFSLAASGFPLELPESSCTGTLVRAPCETRSFLNGSALPSGMVKMAPCNPPSVSRYWIVTVSIFERNRLKNRPPPYGASIVSVPTVPRNTRWLSFSVTTSSTEWIGTLTFAPELAN